jgi:glycosyltransferase involved in cell wall biosynthesis
LVVGTTAGGTGAHVRMLAVGLAGRGIDVSVLGPSSADAAFGFGAAGVTFSPVEFGDRPRPGDVAAVLRLRRLLGHGSATAESDVVHAHGLRAGALTVLALAGLRHRARPRLVVTVHNGPPAGGGARSVVYRLLERVVARGADLVLCVSPDVEALMRSAGAGRVGRAIVPPADPGPLRASGQAPTVPDRTAVSPTTPTTPTTPVTSTTPVTPTTPTTFAPVAASESETTPASTRPLVLAVGRLAAQKDFGTLLVAAAQWRDLDPPPLLAIAGDGPLAGELRAQAASLGIDAAFLGRRDDVAELLAAATVFVLPSRWEGQPLILQEALRAGAAIVATRVGGIPDLAGDDAAVLVPPGDPQALAAAVRAVLADPPLAARLRAAATVRGSALPTAADAVAAALAAYAQALAPT